MDIVVKNVKYDSSLVKDIDVREKNVSINYLLLNLAIKKNYGRFNKQEYQSILSLASDISELKKEWLEYPLTHLVDHLVEFFPYESYKSEEEVVPESDLMGVVKNLDRLLNRELIVNRLIYFVKRAFQATSNQDYALSLRNVALIAAILKEMKEVNRVLRTFDSREQAKQVEQVFYQIYIGLTNSRLEEEVLRSSYKELFPTFQNLFDMKQRMGQGKLLRTYSDLIHYANDGRKRGSTNLAMRPNYLLISLTGMVVVLIVATIFIIGYMSSPTLTLTNADSEQTVIRPIYFSKSIKPEELSLFAFEFTTDEVIEFIADDIRSEYVLSSGFSYSPVEINRNSNRIRAIYKIVGDSFLTSPSIHVDFELREIENPQAPKFIIAGDETSGVITKSGFSVSETYNKSVNEIILDLIGEIIIEDPTIDEYIDNETYHDLFNMDKYNDPITDYTGLETSYELFEFRVEGIDLIESNKNLIDVIQYEIELVVVNHLGLETTLELQIRPNQNRNLSNFELGSFMYYEDFTSGLNPLWTYDDLESLTREFLNYYGLSQLNSSDYEYSLDLEKNELSFIKTDGTSTSPFILPITIFEDNEKPTLEFAEEQSNSIEFDWIDRYNNDFDQLVIDILTEVGDVVVSDDSLTSLNSNPFFNNLLGEYSNTQSLINFDHPVIRLSAITKENSVAEYAPELGELTLEISIFDKARKLSDTYEILIIQPIAEATPETPQN